MPADRGEPLRFAQEINDFLDLLLRLVNAGDVGKRHRRLFPASLLRFALDGENWPEAIGTIAGDDTILIVCNDSRSAGRLAGRIQGMLA